MKSPTRIPFMPAWLGMFAAFAALAASVGLSAAITSAQTKIVFIGGSEQRLTPTDLAAAVGGRQGRPGTSRGPAAGDFVTSVTDGSAFLSWRYDRPVTLARIAHRFVQAADASSLMRAFSLQYRSESGVWTEALHGSWTSETLSARHTYALRPGTRALEWRVVGLEGGTNNQLVMGHFSPEQPAPSRFESFVQIAPIDVLLLLGCWFATILLALSCQKHAGAIALGGGALAVILVVNILVAGVFDAPLLWAPDSNSYVVWPPDPFRMPGLNLVYAGLLKFLDLSVISALQINMVLMSYFGALACLALNVRRYWPFVPLTILPLLWGNFTIHASYVLSEPWFICAVLISLSGILGLIFGGGRKTAVWAALGFLLAVASKGVGVVFFAPAILSYRFIPGSRLRRAKLLSVTLMPALAGYMIMSVYGYTLYGRFTPTVASGAALAQHVAWMLDPEDLPPQHREQGRQAVAELRELYRGMPPLTEPLRYIDFTLARAGRALYGILVPRFDNQVLGNVVAGRAVRRVHDIAAVRDELFGSWARAAIARDPLRYLAHCMLHFWGNWFYSFKYYITVGQSGWDLLWRADHPEESNAPPAYLAYLENWKEKTGRHVFAAVDYRVLDYPRVPSPDVLSWLLMAAALALSFLYLVPVRYPAAVAAMIVWGLFENAYVAGQALFSIAAVRYAELLIPSVPLLIAAALCALAEASQRTKFVSYWYALAQDMRVKSIFRPNRFPINSRSRVAFRAARMSFWAVLILVSGALLLESGVWTREVHYHGPFAATSQGGSQRYVPIPALDAPLSCCVEVRSDSVAQGDRSDLALWVDGREMGPAHSLHSVIDSGETTAFSHWGDGLYFALPADIENGPGTRMTIRYSVRPRREIWAMCALVALALGALLTCAGAARERQP